MKIDRSSIEDKIFYLITGIILTLFTAVVALPIIHIISASFSSPAAVSSGRVFLWPVKPSLQGYKAVFTHKYIVSGYRNTIVYTVMGTFINVMLTMFAAYPLSRRDLPFKGFIMFLFTFTMFFGGGLIPAYILIKNLHLINSFWVMIIPGALSIYNMILARTFLMNSIPQELLDAAQIDGCSDTRYFFNIVLPLAKPVIAVITLYYAVGHWNSYFTAMIYLNDRELYPLQLILRNILIINQINITEIQDPDLIAGKQGLADLLKYALIVVASVPIIMLYPFVQKYFIKGVMIGSLKG